MKKRKIDLKLLLLIGLLIFAARLFAEIYISISYEIKDFHEATKYLLKTSLFFNLSTLSLLVWLAVRERRKKEKAKEKTLISVASQIKKED